MRIPKACSCSVLLLVALFPVPASGGAGPVRDPVALSGVAHGPGGDPLPGAQVLLVPLAREADDSRRELDGQPPPPPTASAMTGPHGAFCLEAPAAGPWKIVVGAPGLVPFERRLLLADDTELPDVELRPDAKLEVQVTDAAGKPLPGARVRAGGKVSFLPGLAASWQPQVRAARTDAQGKALLPRIAGEVLLVQAGVDGQPPAVEREVRTGSVRLRLPAGTSRRIRVLDATGTKPVAGVLVQVGEHRWPAGRTAEDGLAAVPLPATPQNRHEKVLLTAEDGRRLETALGPPGKNEAEPLPLRLPPLESVSGRVVSARDGRPVAGALVWNAESGRAQTAGADGAYRIDVPGLPSPLAVDPEARLTVAARGFLTAETALSPPGPRRDLTVALEPRGRTGFGHVIDRAKKPVAGARVALRRMPAAPSTGPAGLDAGPYEASTGPDGRFEIRDLPAGLYELTARGRGYAPFTVPGVQVPPGSGATDLGTVLLGAGVTVEGQVVDPQGRPVAEAEVRLAATGGSPPGPGTELPAPVLTGADGSFRIEDRRPGETVDLAVHRAGYAPAAAPGLRLPAAQPVRIVLQPTAAVAGITVDPEGRPVAEALVVVLPADPVQVGGAPSTERTGPAQSDENGRFRIEGVLPGRFEIRATAPGHQEARLANLEARPGQDVQDVEVVLAPGAVLAGRVLSPAGRLVPGAEVSLLAQVPAPSPLSGGTTLSDEQGRYRLEGVAPGAQTVQAAHEGYLPTRKKLEVRAGDNPLDLTLEPGAALSGRVVDPAGAPVPGARVSLRPRPEDPRALPSGTSGADGTFHLAGLANGIYHLRAEKSGFARSRDGQEVVVAGRPVTGIEIQLNPGGAIAGQFLGLDLNELAQVQVRTDTGEAGKVLPDGSYRVDHVEPGPRRVVATLARGSRQAEGAVNLEPGAAEARLDLDFGAGLKLTGRVVRGGEPVAGRGVLLSGAEGAGRWSDTDLDGRFHFGGLDAGLYTLKVLSRRGEEQHREEVEIAADRDVLVELSTAAISGRVVDAADQSPIANARVVLMAPEAAGAPGGPVVTEATTDSLGLFQLQGVDDGTWKIRALVADYAPAEADVQVAGAPVDRLELALEATEGLTVEVLLPSGSLPHTVRATVLDFGGRVVATGSYAPGEGGRTRIQGVPPGAWDLLLDADGAALVSIPVTAPGHAGRVVLPRPGELDLRVPALADGQTRAAVRLNDPRGKPFRAPWSGQAASEIALTGGALRIQRLPPGTWSVTVTAGDGRRWAQNAIISPGGTTQLILN